MLILDLHVFHGDINGAFSLIERMARLKIQPDHGIVGVLSDLFVDQTILVPVSERLTEHAQEKVFSNLKYFIGKLLREPSGIMMHYMRSERRSSLICLPARQGYFSYFPRLQSVMAIAIDRLESAMPQLLDDDGFSYLR